MVCLFAMEFHIVSNKNKTKKSKHQNRKILQANNTGIQQNVHMLVTREDFS